VGRNGLLYVSLGDRNYGRNRRAGSHIGKILRIKDDGTVPADNPLSASGWLRKSPLGVAIRSTSHSIRQRRTVVHRRGPQGGDELQSDQSGQNYGWPRVARPQLRQRHRRRGISAPGLEGLSCSGFPRLRSPVCPSITAMRSRVEDTALVGAMRNTGRHIQRVWFNPKGDQSARRSFSRI
jgi:hypothetical protein